MDDSFHDLETELKALQPRLPSARLQERIERELAAGPAEASRPRYATATNLSSWKWSGWRAAGLAAAFAIVAVGVMVLRRAPAPAGQDLHVAGQDPVGPRAASPTREGRYQPIAATNVLYEVKDEGLVSVDGTTPARRVRARYLDTYTWKNPATNASLKWSVPRDEIRVLPASLH